MNFIDGSGGRGGKCGLADKSGDFGYQCGTLRRGFVGNRSPSGQVLALCERTAIDGVQVLCEGGGGGISIRAKQSGNRGALSGANSEGG